MINGINPNKVEEIRETMYRNAVTLFLHTLDSAFKLGILLGIDEDSKTAALNGLRKRLFSTSDKEFVYSVMCDDREGYAKALFRGLVRDYIGTKKSSKITVIKGGN